MAEMNMVEALNLALRQEMSRDKNVVVLGEDVGQDGGVFRVTQNLLKKFPGRVYDTPLAESGIVGTAIGMAAAGLKPVAEIQFEGFMLPAFDQLVNHAARLRNRTRGAYTCPLVVRSPWGGGVKALEHHSDSPEAFFAHVPGLKVVIPSHPYDAKGLLVAAIRDPDPVIFFEPKKIYRSIKEEVPEKEYALPLGQAQVLTAGTDATLITYGSLVKTALETVEKLQNISVEVIDLRTIKPLDVETILSSVKKTGRCVIVHEAPRTLGVGAEIVALINEYAPYDLETPVVRVTGYDTVVPAPKNEQFYLPDGQRIQRALKRVMT